MCICVYVYVYKSYLPSNCLFASVFCPMFFCLCKCQTLCISVRTCHTDNVPDSYILTKYAIKSLVS